MTITVHYTWCDDHLENHWLDERDHCYGESLNTPAYRYLGHIGGGWYKYRPALTVPLPLDWQMALDDHVHVHDLEEWQNIFDDHININF